MEQVLKFTVNEIERIDFSHYDDKEYAIAQMQFLSTRPNSHELKISEEVLRESAPSVLGKWIVAEINPMTGDATTHTPRQVIMGYVPETQTVQFTRDYNDYLCASVNAIISKRYAKEYCAIFECDNYRSVSVEMTVVVSEDDENEVKSFDIKAVTTLGKTVNPSCPESNIQFVRFSSEEGNSYYAKLNKDSLAALKEFAKERKESMAEKTYKVDKSKDAMSETPWGEVDKADMRDKIMEAKNRKTLVKSVYAIVEDGWEDAPSEHLKYPLMELKGETFVYNRYALASALAYARQHNEESVVNKVEKIYKSLGLEDSGKEEKEMAEIEFAAVNIGTMWGNLWDILEEKYPAGNDCGSIYRIVDIYEEDNQKFAIICKKGEDALYRLNFSLTEEGMVVADEIVLVEVNIVETETVRKFAEPEGVDMTKYREFTLAEGDNQEETPAEMSADELKEQIAKLEADIADRDNIIMEKDKELAELRDFKNQCMEAEKMSKVDALMEKYAKFMDKSTSETLRNEGKECAFAEIDAWANKVKASIADKIVEKAGKTDEGFTRMSAPVEMNQNNSGSIWDRL